MSAENVISSKSGGTCQRLVLLTGSVLVVVFGVLGAMRLLDRPAPLKIASPDPIPPSAAEVAKIRSRAEQGDAGAQNELGELYLYGREVRQDSKSAAEWFGKSAAQGHAPAQLNLGMLFEAGQGVPIDYARAAEWYGKAAEQRMAAAQYNLAVLYAYGRGVKRDDSQSLKWLTRSAEQGHGLSEYALGHRYVTGTGVTQDLVQAFKWLTLAEAQNIGDAATALDEIKPKMNRTQLAEARRQAEKFVPTQGAPQ